ncbi:MAG: prepilin-type N-terminal cleavage/methylation domain-containing protein, partial [Anaerovoracaceae bacterium]
MLQLRTILYTKVNKKGFTLAELLVVVAIIAILVAVSIPIFSGKLEEARKNTDLANVRAAKAAAVVEYLTGEY